MSDERVLCPTCVGQHLKSTVHEGGRVRRTSYCPPFYDEDGRKHLHDVNVVPRSFRCSNNHSWVIQNPHKCWCGWTSDEEFPEEQPTTPDRPRAASMPDIILAGSDSEEPPAGYEVASSTDENGFEFPAQPRTFTRLRPK